MDLALLLGNILCMLLGVMMEKIYLVVLKFLIRLPISGLGLSLCISLGINLLLVLAKIRGYTRSEVLGARITSHSKQYKLSI